jgi:hypothetical protein
MVAGAQFERHVDALMSTERTAAHHAKQVMARLTLASWVQLAARVIEPGLYRPIAS